MLRRTTCSFIMRIKSFLKENAFVYFLVYRIINSFLMQTIFEPDEIWQTLEPINYLLMGKGEPTWDWMLGIRTTGHMIIYFIPSLLLYKISSQFYKVYCFTLYKTINALLSALTDYFTYKLYCLYNNNPSNIVICLLLSHGLWLYSPRSHINSLEMLLIVCIVYFIKRAELRSFKCASFDISIILMSYIGYVRPTSVFFTHYFFLKHFRRTFLRIHLIFSVVFSLICLDSYFYKEFIVPPVNFYVVNIKNGINKLFGQQPMYSHLLFLMVLVGFPLLYLFKTFNHLFLKKKSKIVKVKNLGIDTFYKEVLYACFSFLFFYSLIAHKEMRFLLPIIPFVLLLIAKYLNKGIIFFMGIQLIFSIYVGLMHQRYHETLNYINNLNESKEINVFNATCPYSLPNYSFLCKDNINIRSITGNPDIFSLTKPRFYKKFGSDFKVHEYDSFIKNDYKYFNYDSYDYILMYDWTYLVCKDHLSGYNIVKKCNYCFFRFEAEKGNVIYILKRKLNLK